MLADVEGLVYRLDASQREDPTSYIVFDAARVKRRLPDLIRLGPAIDPDVCLRLAVKALTCLDCQY